MKHPHADSIKSHIDKIRVIASQAEINRTSLEAIEHEVHMYGRALETLSERLVYDLDAQRCQRMQIAVQTKRANTAS